jgi:hypothetical protein
VCSQTVRLFVGSAKFPGALDEGRHAMNRSFEVVGSQIFFVGSRLVDMYAKRGSMEDA